MLGTNRRATGVNLKSAESYWPVEVFLQIIATRKRILIGTDIRLPQKNLQKYLRLLDNLILKLNAFW